MLPRGRAGVATSFGYAGFAPVTEPLQGNNLPGWTGSTGSNPSAPGPHPRTQPMGGQVGRFDGASGSDPSRPKMSPRPWSSLVGAWGEGRAGSAPGPAGPPIPYGGNAPRPTDGAPSRLGPELGGDPLPVGRPSFWRNGFIGFNDQLQVRDRHAYWSMDHQRFHGPPSNETGGGANPQDSGPPRPSLDTINVSVNPQIGSDASRNQDDLTRPYTWLGQQDGTNIAINGGVPGLWQEYGNRGLSSGIHDPTNGQGGRSMVSSGPPHGLHSNTIADGLQLGARYKSTPQNRPVRLDRPSNSTSAGQSYSQTVQFQGQTGGATSTGKNFGINFGTSGGWKGSS